MEALVRSAKEIVDELKQVYIDFHQHPELSLQESRTAQIVADMLEASGYAVTRNVGGHGVVGVLENGPGAVVWLRADTDGLPLREQTGLPYASEVRQKTQRGDDVGVMHACGHDMHMTCLLGAAQLLSDNRPAWHGTVVLIFQPAEEIGAGAQAMIADNIAERFPRPDVVLGQHVLAGPAGHVAVSPGAILAAADSLRVTLHGIGAHGSLPESSVDPIVMASAVVMRLQGIVAREVAPRDSAVVTVGSLHAGTQDNIIPDSATLELSIRSHSETVRARVLNAIERIVNGESAASGAPSEPDIESTPRFPLTVNDAAATDRVVRSFTDYFGSDLVGPLAPLMGSEDFSFFGTATGAPSVFWTWGGTDDAEWAKAVEADRVDLEIAKNHSPQFAPTIMPTLLTGIECLLLAAAPWIEGGSTS